MEEIKLWLSSNGLGEYWHNFEEHGWEELSLLTEMSDVDLELCITKRGHRAKFKKALRSFTNASAASGNSASLNSAGDLEKNPVEVDGIGMPREEVNHASQLAHVTEITTQLDTAGSLHIARETGQTDSFDTAREVDRTERDAFREMDRTDSVDVVRELDRTCSVDAVPEADMTDSVETVRELNDAVHIVEGNRTEEEPDATTSTPARNEVSRFVEARIESW